MTHKEVITALRSAPSRSKRELLDTAADMIEAAINKPVVSNADRIRAMSDEELAEFMAPSKMPHEGFPWCQPVGKVKCGKPSCNGCALVWLQQPAGEG